MAIHSGPERRSTPQSSSSTSIGWTLPKTAPWSCRGANSANAAVPASPWRSSGSVEAATAASISPTHAAVTASRGRNVSGTQA